MSHVSAGFVAVLISYTSAAVIVFQAAMAGGADTDHISSWMWALGIGMGISSIGLSIYYKNPVMIAWSTPGAALLVTSLPGIAMSDAIGAFLFCSALITVCGVTGWFDKIMKLVPHSLANAMLAGVLLRFSLEIFPAFIMEMTLVGVMVGVYIMAKWKGSSYSIPLAFASGVLCAFLQGDIAMIDQPFDLTVPIFTMPTWNTSVMIGVGLPLFIVTMASQNVPGIAVLRAHGYDTPASPVIAWSGGLGLILAPFGGFAFNLAAITAAICMGEDVDKNKEKRYLAAVWSGIFYIVVGLFGAAVAGFLAAFPTALVSAIAGLALLGTVANSSVAALSDIKSREAAILTFVVTASGGALFTIGAPFWGLVVGLIVHYLMQFRKS